MPPKEVTIYDLAAVLNVSPTTVSRALKNHFSIGKETTRAVKELAAKMGYQPNTVASNLRNQKTNTIGVLIPWINRPFISSAISGIEEVANAAGYHVIISQSNDSFLKEVTNAQNLFANRVDGLIVSLAIETTGYQHFLPFLHKGIPLVFFDRVGIDLDASKVMIDNRRAAFAATEHLISNGYTRIAHFAGSQNRSIYRERLQGYTDALHQYHLPVDEAIIVSSNLTMEEGAKATRHLLSLPQPPNAIFSANDNAAVSAIQCLKRAGIKIPQEVAVVGFNNDPVSLIIEPALTTVQHPAFAMGQHAAREFLQQVQLPTTSRLPQTLVLETNLLVRESSQLNKI